jgi:hypothetical protein
MKMENNPIDRSGTFGNQLALRNAGIVRQTLNRGEGIMLLNRVSGTCLKVGMVALAVVMFAWSAPTAKAGAIRYAGRMIAKGTVDAAAATAAGGQAAATKIQTDAGPATSRAGRSVKHAFVHAGHVTTNGAKDGGAAIYYGAKRTPHTVAVGAKTLWRAVW